jgi:hypothetical protein
MPEPGEAEHSRPAAPHRPSGRHRQRTGLARWPRRPWRSVRTWLTLTGAIVVMALAASLLTGVNPLHLTGGASPGRLASGAPGQGVTSGQHPSGVSGPGTNPAGSGTAPGSGGSQPGGGHPAPVAAAGPGEPAPASSCPRVAHIGDSTSEGMVSPAYLPHKSQRLGAQYARVGTVATHLDISGARSILETLPGQKNAAQVAARLTRKGYRGCWVLALGTNDTANVTAGSPVSRMARIKKMMSVIGDQPVMWVNLISQLDSGVYAEAGMRKWNATLVKACAAYPNMRVFDWAAVARPGWFIADGVHYTSAGYAVRGKLIAGALATAFPRTAQQPATPSRCLVS